MIKLNIQQAKTHLSSYLNHLKEGETMVLGKGNCPIAEIRPLAQASMEPRPIGLGKGECTILAGFKDDLTDDLLQGFGDAIPLFRDP